MLMPNFHLRYIEKLGLLSIILLSSKTFIKKKKINIVEEVACLRNIKHYLMTVRWIQDPNLGFSYKIEKKKEISKEEYKRLLDKNTP
jgi:hypothetical protein